MLAFCLPDILDWFSSRGVKVGNAVGHYFNHNNLVFCFFGKWFIVYGHTYLVNPYSLKASLEFLGILLQDYDICRAPHLKSPGIFHIPFPHRDEYSKTHLGIPFYIFKFTSRIGDKVHV